MATQNDENGPLEGEVVLYQGDRRSRNRDGGFWDEDTIAEAIRARALGFPLRKIAERLGCSHEQVRSWCGEANKKRRYGDADIVKVRAEMAIELETAEHEALRLVRMYPGTELALKALNTLNGLVRTRANLLGAVAPVRVHVDVQEVMQEDLELRDMVNTAKAKAAADAEQIKRDFEARSG